MNNTWEFKSVFEQKHQNSRVPSHPIRRREGEKHVHIRTNEDGDIAKRMDNVAAVEDGEGIININYYDGGDVPDGIVSGHGYANDCHNNFISDSCNLSKICPDLSLDK